MFYFSELCSALLMPFFLDHISWKRVLEGLFRKFFCRADSSPSPVSGNSAGDFSVVEVVPDHASVVVASAYVSSVSFLPGLAIVGCPLSPRRQ